MSDDDDRCTVHSDGWHRSFIIATSDKRNGADHTCACWLPLLYPEGRRQMESARRMMWDGTQVLEMSIWAK